MYHPLIFFSGNVSCSGRFPGDVWEQGWHKSNCLPASWRSEKFFLIVKAEGLTSSFKWRLCKYSETCVIRHLCNPFHCVILYTVCSDIKCVPQSSDNRVFNLFVQCQAQHWLDIPDLIGLNRSLYWYESWRLQKTY